MKKIEQYFKELLEQHPYKQVGNYLSYSQYNEGWQDALDLAMQVVKQIQLEAIEESCRVCAENAEIVDDILWRNVDKQSILNCIEILKKEIE